MESFRLISNKNFEREKFYLNTQELAARGVLGGVKTRDCFMRKTFSRLISYLEHPQLEILFVGSNGSGKTRLVKEFQKIDSFFQRKWKNSYQSELLLVECSDLDLNSLDYLRIDELGSSSVLFRGIENLSLVAQTALLGKLKTRDIVFSQDEQLLPRLYFTSERSMEIQVKAAKMLFPLWDRWRENLVYFPNEQNPHEDVAVLGRSSLFY